MPNRPKVRRTQDTRICGAQWLPNPLVMKQKPPCGRTALLRWRFRYPNKSSPRKSDKIRITMMMEKNPPPKISRRRRRRRCDMVPPPFPLFRVDPITLYAGLVFLEIVKNPETYGFVFSHRFTEPNHPASGFEHVPFLQPTAPRGTGEKRPFGGCNQPPSSIFSQTRYRISSAKNGCVSLIHVVFLTNKQEN